MCARLPLRGKASPPSRAFPRRRRTSVVFPDARRHLTFQPQFGLGWTAWGVDDVRCRLAAACVSDARPLFMRFLAREALPMSVCRLAARGLTLSCSMPSAAPVKTAPCSLRPSSWPARFCQHVAGQTKSLRQGWARTASVPALFGKAKQLPWITTFW